MRLARADTGTPIREWLQMPIRELSEWVDIISDESEKLKQEIKKGR